MDGLGGLDDEFDGLPFAEAPAQAPRPTPAAGKPDADDVIVLDSIPPPAPPRATPRKRQVVAVDVTGEEPTRQVIELEEYLPIARPSPPKPPAAVASATPSPAPPRVAPVATTPPPPLPSAAALAHSISAHAQPVGTVRASSMSAASPPHVARATLPPVPAPAPLPPLPSPMRSPLPPPSSVPRPPAPVPPPAQSTVRTPGAPLSVAVPPAAAFAPAPAVPSAYSAAELGLMASIDALRGADVGRMAGAGAARSGRGYNCGRCGQPKKGHVCSADATMAPPKAKKHKTVTAASSLGPARPPPAASGVADDMSLLAAIEASLGSSAPPAPAPHGSFRLLNAPDDGEERLKPFKSKPTSAVRERINRALSQKMFLISRKTNSELEQAFTVLGSRGNVYEVKICQLPSCSCPDFEKGNFCKHILFVYLKVLRVSSGSQLIYQHALLQSEVRQIFASAPRDPSKSVLADEAVQRRFKELAADVREVGRKPITDHCPVCYEVLRPNQRLLWCRFSCGNNVHEECFSEWSKTKTASGQTPTCVYCRASWAQSGARPPPAVVGEEGYVNLGALQRNMPTERPEYHDWRSSWY